MTAEPLSDRFPRQFRAWVNMLGKAYDPRHPEYPGQGGVGIEVAEGLRESFSAYLDRVGSMPDKRPALASAPEPGYMILSLSRSGMPTHE
jgi:hypothetical protein